VSLSALGLVVASSRIIFENKKMMTSRQRAAFRSVPAPQKVVFCGRWTIAREPALK
jgi:hypothetical protein